MNLKINWSSGSSSAENKTVSIEHFTITVVRLINLIQVRTMEFSKYLYIMFILFLLYTCCSKTPVESTNSPPIIISLTSNPNMIEMNRYTTITCNANDPDDDKLKYTWSAPIGTITGESNIVNWKSPHPGDDFPLASYYPISCRVEDPKGLRDEEVIEITVVSHYLPFSDFRDPFPYVHFRVPEKMTLVINDNSVWYDLWDKYWSNTYGNGNKTPLPEIDFSEKMIIGVFWGAGWSGGGSYLKSIKSICVANDTLYVKVILFPMSGAFAEIMPYDLVIIKRSDLPVEFVGKDYLWYFK